MKNNAKLRAIPAVEKVLQSLGEVDLPRPAILALVRRELAVLRKEKTIPDFESILERIRDVLDVLRSARIQPVINGAGIIIHTNLGRSPLSPAVVDTLSAIAGNYSNLEYDLCSGERGSRAGYLEHNLALLCGAEAATVVNNCAAALVLILRHFTSDDRKQVIISRGELVQIGGGFRIHEILEASGATLREIGATNKTTAADYAKAIGPQTALILKVHRSNFFMGGFVESPSTEEIAQIARRKRILLVEDLGSGAVIATEQLAPIEHEPTPAEVLKGHVDLVTFSGDKLLGGPQAGIIAGKTKLIAALKREPFFRALRCDKLILSALQTVVDLYLQGRAAELIPTLAMLSIPESELRARAQTILSAIENLPIKSVIGAGKAQIGGGALPRSNIASITLDLQPQSCSLPAFAAKLRRATPPVIGYIAGSKYKLDLRTIFAQQDQQLIAAIRRAAAGE
jgi:L-seryl-tRNA(Ser) seleniumtransferase